MAPARFLPREDDLISRRPDQLSIGHHGMPQAPRSGLGAEQLFGRVLRQIECPNRPGLATTPGHERINAALRRHTSVRQCAAIGRPDRIGVMIHAPVYITQGFVRWSVDSDEAVLAPGADERKITAIRGPYETAGCTLLKNS